MADQVNQLEGAHAGSTTPQGSSRLDMDKGGNPLIFVEDTSTRTIPEQENLQDAFEGYNGDLNEENWFGQAILDNSMDFTGTGLGDDYLPYFCTAPPTPSGSRGFEWWSLPQPGAISLDDQTEGASFNFFSKTPIDLTSENTLPLSSGVGWNANQDMLMMAPLDYSTMQTSPFPASLAPTFSARQSHRSLPSSPVRRSSGMARHRQSYRAGQDRPSPNLLNSRETTMGSLGSLNTAFTVPAQSYGVPVKDAPCTTYGPPVCEETCFVSQPVTTPPSTSYAVYIPTRNEIASTAAHPQGVPADASLPGSSRDSPASNAGTSQLSTADKRPEYSQRDVRRMNPTQKASYLARKAAGQVKRV